MQQTASTKVHVLPAVEVTSMSLLTQGPLSRLGAPAAVVVVEIFEAAEAARPVIQLTMKVPASSAKVPDDLAVEATLMNPLLWGPSLWPSSPVVNVVEIVVARAAAEAARVPINSTMVGVYSTMGVPGDPAVEATSMDPLWWVLLLWPTGSPVVVDVVETPRATAEALGVPMYSTMGVPASSAMVPKSPAVEATPMDPLWWGPSSWPPGSPVVDNVGIVTARAVVEAAGPDEKLTREVPLSRGFSVARNRKVAREGSLARSLSFTRK